MISQRKILLVLSVFLISNFGFSQSSGRELMRKVFQNYLTHYNISYKVRYSAKHTMSKDTSSIITYVFLQRDQKDTVFGGQFLIEYRPKRKVDSIQKIIKYYNSKDIFLIYVGSMHTAFKFDRPAKEKWAITGNWTVGVLETFLLQPIKLKTLYENKKNNITYIDSDNKAIVHIKYPSGAKRILHINKANKTIEKMALIIKDRLGTQYKQWVFSNINFNSHNSKVFKAKAEKYLDNYDIKVYKPKGAKYYALIPNGNKAISLEGFLYPDYSKKIIIHPTKITILDFWYTTCGPCIKAIPYLKKIKNKYGDKIQIIGINDKESTPNEKNRIKGFLQRFPINYKILLVNKIPKAYNIRAYPTLYLIGKDGKVKYSKIGFWEKTYKEVDSIIQDLINKQEK